MMNKTTADALERIFWTAVQAGLGVVTFEAFNLPKGWIPVVAILLAAVKTAVATQIGVKGSASTLPVSLDSSAPTFAEPVAEPVAEVPSEEV
jgi:hypothetical protein